jgi:hypothetical protein
VLLIFILSLNALERLDRAEQGDTAAWTFFANDKDRIGSITTRSWAWVIP